MKKKRFSEQRILKFLKEAEAGMPIKELCRKHGFSCAAFYGWRAKFGGMLRIPAMSVQHSDRCRYAIPI